jgi:hypothetical protein
VAARPRSDLISARRQRRADPSLGNYARFNRADRGASLFRGNVTQKYNLLVITDEVEDVLFQLQQHHSVPGRDLQNKELFTDSFKDIMTWWLPRQFL